MLENAGYLRARKTSKYTCSKCDYTTSKLSNWKRHVVSKKHISVINAEYLGASEPISKIWTCECGKKYKHNQSYYRHKNVCPFLKDNNIVTKDKVTKRENNNQIDITQNKVIELLEHSNELLEKSNNRNIELEKKIDQLEELVKTAHPSITNNNFNNCLFVLNTYCASAISMNEFTQNLQLTSEDLVYTKQNGYIEGVSQVFIKGLKDLEPTQRPIQCTDKKGKNIYVKEEGTWEIDKGEVLGSHISLVSKKQVDALELWEQQNPNWETSEEKTNAYMKLVSEVMGGSSNEERTRNHKLIRQKIGQNCKFSDIV